MEKKQEETRSQNSRKVSLSRFVGRICLRKPKRKSKDPYKLLFFIDFQKRNVKSKIKNVLRFANGNISKPQANIDFLSQKIMDFLFQFMNFTEYISEKKQHAGTHSVTRICK